MSQDTLFDDHHIFPLYRPETITSAIATFGAAGSDGALVYPEQIGRYMDFLLFMSLGTGSALHEFKAQINADGVNFFDVPGMVFEKVDPGGGAFTTVAVRVHVDAIPQALIDGLNHPGFGAGTRWGFRWQRKITAAGGFSTQPSMVCVSGGLHRAPAGSGAYPPSARLVEFMGT